MGPRDRPSMTLVRRSSHPMATFADHGTEHLTFLFEDGDDGWVTATIAEEPAAISQGRSRDEARRNVLDALRDLEDDATPADRVGESARELSEAVRELLHELVDTLRDRVRQRVA